MPARDDREASVYEFVRKAIEEMRRDLAETIRREVAGVHSRIDRARDRFDRFREEDFEMLGRQLVTLENDVSPSAAKPGWIKRDIDSLNDGLSACRDAWRAGIAAESAAVDLKLSAVLGKYDARLDTLQRAQEEHAKTLQTYRNAIVLGFIGLIVNEYGPRIINPGA